MSRCGAAAHFGVGVSTVISWVRRYHETGSVGPAKIGGYKPVLLTAHRDFVHSRFADQPELTLRGLQRGLGRTRRQGQLWRGLELRA